MVNKLSNAKIEAKIKVLNHGIKQSWVIKSDKLYKCFAFNDFLKAFEFMTKVAVIAENANHHPDWSNIYNKVDIYLTTHEVQGISERDFDLAALIEEL
ncbi:MAG: 4a-hydroxytetrahydrobiopterin dehydratase [Enterobacterales bacterium]|jgi:4a-hydroxytetrahydrobiopterin dehydratase